MANNLKEYHRGLNAGLQMAYRLLKDSGKDEAAEIIAEEVRKRGVMKITTSSTIKELDAWAEEIYQRMYETYLCMALDVLHCEFDFGRKRCLRFMDNWNLKTECMVDQLETWEEKVQAIREEMNIDVPTEAMKRSKLLA